MSRESTQEESPSVQFRGVNSFLIVPWPASPWGWILVLKRSEKRSEARSEAKRKAKRSEKRKKRKARSEASAFLMKQEQYE